MKMIVWLWVLFLPGAGVQAQNFRVSGNVRSVDSGLGISGVSVVEKGTQNTTVTDAQGWYALQVRPGARLVFSFLGFETHEEVIGTRSRIDVALVSDSKKLSEVVAIGAAADSHRRKQHELPNLTPAPPAWPSLPSKADAEAYASISENSFHDALREPLSTFSIDVDRAAYSNVRRFINNGKLPPTDAVRIEEMINYFQYDYPDPTGDHPFTIFSEVGPAPWNKAHHLVHIGIQGRHIPTEALPASNLVFLIDVSGSMASENKLPLVKASLKILVEQLRARDCVSIVVYAGAAGLVLPATAGHEKGKILAAIDQLEAGGATAGGMGIRLAYQVARQNFRAGGNNRVILATDGDFNVGESSSDALEKLIEAHREEGVFLTVLGYGMGNYKDDQMEVLADRGNGNYAYIDNLPEAEKTLVQEFGGTLFTIAGDVKLQVEFNPAKVSAYRLLGYENRMLKTEDFADDRKDAGELGAGHTVTALYEIIPAGVASPFFPELKYQQPLPGTRLTDSNEWLTVKFRYKKPGGATGIQFTQAVTQAVDAVDQTSENFRWSAAVAAFGMLLRQSSLLTGYSHEDVVLLAQGARGRDEEGYRAEMIHLVRSTRHLARH